MTNQLPEHNTDCRGCRYDKYSCESCGASPGTACTPECCMALLWIAYLYQTDISNLCARHHATFDSREAAAIRRSVGY